MIPTWTYTTTVPYFRSDKWDSKLYWISTSPDSEATDNNEGNYPEEEEFYGRVGDTGWIIISKK